MGDGCSHSSHSAGGCARAAACLRSAASGGSAAHGRSERRFTQREGESGSGLDAGSAGLTRTHAKGLIMQSLGLPQMASARLC